MSDSLRVYVMDSLKWAIFPGINLHARERFTLVPRFFEAGQGGARQLLDAGFGNGMLSWQAWRRGYRVVGVSLKASEVASAQRQFNLRLGVSEREMCFLEHSLYETNKLKEQFGCFDEIVCADVIEHIRDDVGVCSAMYDLLKPGGVLHLTSPNSNHYYNATFPLDMEEKGGHVRAGYNHRSFAELLEPIGFHIEHIQGFGGVIRQWFNSRTKAIQERYGPWFGVPLFALGLPLVMFDTKVPKVPFSYYVRARKPAASTEGELFNCSLQNLSV